MSKIYKLLEECSCRDFGLYGDIDDRLEYANTKIINTEELNEINKYYNNNISYFDPYLFYDCECVRTIFRPTLTGWTSINTKNKFENR